MSNGNIAKIEQEYMRVRRPKYTKHPWAPTNCFEITSVFDTKMSAAGRWIRGNTSMPAFFFRNRVGVMPIPKTIERSLLPKIWEK